LYGTTGLELSDDTSIANKSAGADVLDLEANQVRRTQLTVNREVEQSEVPCGGMAVSMATSLPSRPPLRSHERSMVAQRPVSAPQRTFLVTTVTLLVN